MPKVVKVLGAIAIVAVLSVMVGCAENPKSKKQYAVDQWKAARAGVLYSLAKQQYETGNFDKSRETTGQALALQPKNAALRILSAKIAIEQAQLELAERELKSALTDDPANAEAEYLCGVVYQRWQRAQDAFDCYTRAYTKAPSELPYLLAKAEMLVNMNRLPEALAALQEKVVYFEHSGVIRDAVGQMLMQQKRYSEAAVTLREASILSPDEPQIREHLGLALFYARQYRDSADVLARLLKTEPYSKRADLLLALGECQCRLGNPREGRESFQTAAQIDSSLPGVWTALARAALLLDDADRAELALRKSLAIDANSSEAHLLLGYVRLKQGRTSDALLSFRQASALDPTDTVSLCMVGYALEKSGRHTDAMRCYAQALQLKPHDELATQLMAAIEPRQ